MAEIELNLLCNVFSSCFLVHSTIFLSAGYKLNAREKSESGRVGGEEVLKNCKNIARSIHKKMFYNFLENLKKM